MLGSQVASDLEVTRLAAAVPTHLPWGSEFFLQRLNSTTDNTILLKKRQLPYAAFKKDVPRTQEIRAILQDLKPAIADVEACIATQDSLANESIQQIFFAKQSTAKMLNSNATYLQAFLFWKTLFLPGFAILAPLLGMLVPYFLLKLFGRGMTTEDYLLHLRSSILKQISIPTMLRARGANDRLGGFFEILFIGFTLIMFISGIWNQVSSALHLRSIYAQLEARGKAVQQCLEATETILQKLRDSYNPSAKYAYKELIERGAQAYDKCKHLVHTAAAATAGSLWNDSDAIGDLRAFLGEVDATTALAVIPAVHIVKYGKLGMTFKGLVHPCLEKPVDNDFSSSGHTLLTGPNRGGKSTFCKALGLAIVTAQSWGIAWAAEAHLSPFASIHTALEPAGKLGFASTFEAEIVFAKKVLDEPAKPMFVMMDEIFHSTNAVDGVRASKVFMSSLYAKSSVLSVISTHYRDLATHFASVTTPLQLIAEGDDDQLIYTYKLAPGISTKSSVDELLRIHGLTDTTPGAETVAKKDSQMNQNK